MFYYLPLYIFDSFSLSNLLGCAIIVLIGYFIYKFNIYPLYLSPLCKIPGPPVKNFFYGNVRVFEDSELGERLVNWEKQYGSLFRIHGFLNRTFIVTTDPKVVQNIMTTHAYDYRKSRQLPQLTDTIGEGLLLAEGNVHHRQRKMMNPAFSFANTKEIVPIVVRISHQLKEIIMNQIGDKKEERITINSLISKATLDIIGLVGFNYELNSLTTKSELAEAYDEITNTNKSYWDVLIILLSGYFPFVRKIPITSNIRFMNAIKTVGKISENLVKERKNKIAKGELKGNDLLTLIIKLNEDLSKDEKMTDDEIKYQIMTFLAAGHHTTSQSLSWSLYFLSKHPEIQDRLREELVQAFPDPNFQTTFDEIEHLKYLDSVIKEILRFIPPVSLLSRISTKDEVVNGYFIPKGSMFGISINTIHHKSSTWGEDANEFNPSRWLDPEIKSKVTNYTYLPFNTGQRSCIGIKLAIAEFKIILAVLIRNFIFKEVEGHKITTVYGVVTRPVPDIDLFVSKIGV
ncbi:cytochrome P450 [Gigaspora margarita]|uniref:Cytochrome P450 n=1 Tax=Gigaspora margarita TaxID=4874 RepID=A0A8H4ESH6_GIGMA|nr:cytochrome P450 [Gigaspora margarita]